MIIDSHQHLWQIGRNGHEWPTSDLSAIWRDFESDDLHTVATTAGITATVLVQSQSSDADTDWMLSIAANDTLIKGVVGWADLAAPSSVKRATFLAQQPKFKGLRPMLQGLNDDEWILQPAVQPALAAMADLGLRFDALIFPRHLKVIDRLAKAFPGLRIVIDHCAKPPIAANDSQATNAWRDGIAIVAQNANIFCKLSGVITEASDGQTIDDTAPYADHVLDSFGPERLMWGSDWPVVNLRTTYATWLDWSRVWLDTKSPEARAQILSGTARRFYQLT